MSDLSPSKSAPPTKITVLISGKGSNLGKIIEATQSGLLSPHRIIRVISNRKNAGGLKLAEEANIPTSYFNLLSGGYHAKGEKDEEVIRQAREKYDADLAQMILEDEPDLIVCAGWMHILSPPFHEAMASASVPVINLHPALPGEYDGISAIERAWNDFQAAKLRGGRTGVMVHYVINEVDRGEPLVTRQIPCHEGESLEDLTERVHGVEHQIIIEGTGLAINHLWERRRQ